MQWLVFQSNEPVQHDPSLELKEELEMAIDQSSLGQHIQEQMAAIEADPNVPDDAEIGGIVTLVEVVTQPDSEGAVQRGFRVRSNRPPHVTIGMFEEAKATQLNMIMGG
jgi:hypothetical protein